MGCENRNSAGDLGRAVIATIEDLAWAQCGRCGKRIDFLRLDVRETHLLGEAVGVVWRALPHACAKPTALDGLVDASDYAKRPA